MAEKKETEPKKARKKTGTKGPNLNAGRKNYWDLMQMEHKLKAIEGWARNGSTNEDIWTMLKISKELFYRWQRDKPAFAAAIRAGKFESNGELLNAAFRQTTGHYVQVTEPFKVKTVKQFEDKNGKTYWEEVEEVIDHTYMKYFPPNTTMGIFMLKNRLPEFYRDKVEHEHSGDVSVMFVDDIPNTPAGDEDNAED